MIECRLRRTEAYTFVDALKHAGTNLTRASLMSAATHLNEASNPFLVSGIKVRTTPTFRYPVAQVGLQRWQKGHWELVGGLHAARP